MAEKILVAKKSDLSDGTITMVSTGGAHVFLANVGGEIFAMDNTCSHKGGPLNEGVLEDCMITCPWHAAKFDVRTGKVAEEMPWAKDLVKYPVIIEGDNVYIEI